ncbi:MAG: EAL domain-containing protein [Pseudomonadota bacterium]
MNKQKSLAIKTYGILILVVGIFAISMVQSLREIRQDQSFAAETMALDYWNASQARFELERTLGALDAFAAGSGDVTKDELLRRIDIFWSRMPLLFKGNQSRDIVAFTDAEVTAPAIMARIDSLSEQLRTFSRSDRETYAGLRQTFLSFREPIQDILLRIHHKHGVGQTTLSQKIGELHRQHTLSLMGALISGIVLIFLLLNAIKAAQRAQGSANDARAELEGVINALPLSVDVVDSQGRLVLLNAGARTARGIEDGAGIGHLPQEVGSINLLDECNDKVLSEGQAIAAQEIALNHPKEPSKTWLVSKVPVAGQLGDVRKVLTVGVDITEQKNAESRIRYLAHHDTLTGLPNRTYLQEYLTSALDRCARENRQLALHSIDFDHFKEVNDRFGHEAGDQFLAAASQRLRTCLPASSVAVRMGGDEFAVIQENFADANDVHTLARKLLDAFKDPIAFGGQQWFSTISIGASFSKEIGADQQQLLKRADLALYEAKECGGNAVFFYGPAMRRRHAHRFGIQQDLRSAIANEELVLHYQPKVRLSDHELTGVEALLRWHHPEKGAIEPSVFVAAAEDCDLIAPLGEWVLRKACTQLAAWQQSGLDPPPIAINLSVAQFLRQDMAGLIKRVLDETGVSPSLLELEVTESVLVEHSGRMRDMLGELQALKLGITLDDFGTGYSSLSYLQSFPIDKIKIDKAFVQPIADGGGDISIIRAIIAMAHSLDIQVIAEGVETGAQHRVLELIGCDEIQGFLIARALPPSTVVDWQAPSRSVIIDSLPSDFGGAL